MKYMLLIYQEENGLSEAKRSAYGLPEASETQEEKNHVLG